MKLHAIASIGFLFLASNTSAAAITQRARIDRYEWWGMDLVPLESILSNHLQVTLSIPEEATTPPTIIVNLTNTHPTLPITFVNWDTPITPQPIDFGLLSITPPGSSTPMDLERFRVYMYYMLPITAKSLVTLEPGEELSQASKLGDTPIPDYPELDARTKLRNEEFMEEMRGDKSGPVKIQIRGSWQGGWVGKNTEEVVDSGGLEDFSTYAYPHTKSGMLLGDFESNVAELKLE